ncbi:hypothetical protein QFC19_008329 [Naganishia cerealis]|uniref:Uncharacterized protein n=1 Tax=Naganishia cerealis TaxID=610337 RepID=A0ACC2V2X9_9TREE|nr:hypothetical protein QFC19_008329 [Naganishia cerealis]
MNVYDVRLTDEWPACGMNWPPDLTDIYQYLRRPDVVKALHASDKETAWVECDNIVSSQLYLRKSPAAVHLLPGILERGVKVMMFAGDEDLICNYKGIERLIDRMQWNGGQGLGGIPVEDWYVNDTYAGTWQTGRNLTYVRVAGGSHMVGYDLPEITNDMITRFMDVDMSMVVGDIASVPSRLGDKERPQDEEERVPLGHGEAHEMNDYRQRSESLDSNGPKTNSGNGFARNDYGDGEVVFELGEDDDQHDTHRAGNSRSP